MSRADPKPLKGGKDSFCGFKTAPTIAKCPHGALAAHRAGEGEEQRPWRGCCAVHTTTNTTQSTMCPGWKVSSPKQELVHSHLPPPQEASSAHGTVSARPQCPVVTYSRRLAERLRLELRHVAIDPLSAPRPNLICQKWLEISSFASSLLRVPCASTEKPTPHQTLQARSQGISGKGKRLCFHGGGGGPHSVPQLSSGPGASSSGWMRTSAWAAEGTPAPDPVTNPDGCQGGPEGAPEQPAPMQLPPRGLEASQQASGLLPTHHLLLPSYFLGAGTCFLCLLLHPHGCRTLPGPGRVPVGVCRLNEWSFGDSQRLREPQHGTCMKQQWPGATAASPGAIHPLSELRLCCLTLSYENVQVRKLPSVVPQRKQTWSMQSWSLWCQEAMGSLILCPEGSSPT